MISIGSRQVKGGGVCAVSNTQILLTHVAYYDNTGERVIVRRFCIRQSAWCEIIQYQYSANDLIRSWIIRRCKCRLKVCHKVDVVARHQILIITIIDMSVIMLGIVGERYFLYNFILFPFFQLPILIFRLCIDMYGVTF